MAITEFRGEYSWLSNFEASTVELDGITYPTVEHAFQAAKTDNPAEREMIRQTIKPGSAKRTGRRVTLRPDWEQVKVEVMRSLLRQKFATPRYAALLEATGNEELVEGNRWNDRFWGVCNGVGKNTLGRLIMEIREERRSR